MHSLHNLVLFALGLSVACNPYDPTFQQGVPCAPGGLCPEGQICHSDDRCYDPDQVPDAGTVSDATLAALQVSEGELVPPFDPQVTSYILDLGIRAEELVVTPTAADSESAEIMVDGTRVESGADSLPIALNLGTTVITLEVITEDGQLTTYEVVVDRGAALLQRAYVKASNTNSGDGFGGLRDSLDKGNAGVAISGDTIVVAAPGEDSGANGVGADQTDNSASNAGAVYVFVRSGDSWTQQAYIKASNSDVGDSFGGSFGPNLSGSVKGNSGLALALSGDILAVGSVFEASLDGTQSDNGGNAVGAVYVFVRSGTTWMQEAYLKASNRDDGDAFGCSLALSGHTLAVGAYLEDSSSSSLPDNDGASSSGAVYVFTRSGTSWTQQAYLKASNIDAQDSFGTTVALSGDTLAVGAFKESSSTEGVNGNQADNTAPEAGAVYIFNRVGVTWSQQAYIKASNTNSGDGFGASVALAGDTLAVAAPFEDSGAVGVGGNQQDNGTNDAGAVYVFRRSGAIWSQEAYIKASNSNADDRFGLTVALSEDGAGLAVSAPEEDSAAIGLGGNDADNSRSASGVVYLFRRANGTWSQFHYIKASNAETNDRFGAGVAFSGRTLVITGPEEDSAATGVGGSESDNGAEEAGALYVFE